MARLPGEPKYIIQCVRCHARELGYAGRRKCQSCKRGNSFKRLVEKPRRIEYIPSPEEIQSACLAIQATWSPGERKSREALKSPSLALDRKVCTISKGTLHGRPSRY